MSEQVPFSEYEYYREERIGLAGVRPATPYALYMSIGVPDHELTVLPVNDTVLAKAACALEPYEENVVPVGHHDYVARAKFWLLDDNDLAKRTDITSWEIREVEDCFVIPDDSVAETRLFFSMFDLLVGRFGADLLSVEGALRVLQAYVVGQEINEASIKVMYQTHGRDGDGSAGVREPRNPTGPLPAIQREL